MGGMKFDSPLFDSVRIKPNKGKKQAPPKPRVCEWEGCERRGEFKAPKGRGRENEFHYFCREHVHAYNKNYNYFSGMDDDAMRAYQKSDMTGHRPTWAWGHNADADTIAKTRGHRPTASGRPRNPWAAERNDPFEFFAGQSGPRAGGKTAGAKTANRPVGNAAAKSFSVLGLEIDADAATIKTRFKELVKRNHPDLNGGNRAGEDRLREVIRAYNTLKSSGFC